MPINKIVGPLGLLVSLCFLSFAHGQDTIPTWVGKLPAQRPQWSEWHNSLLPSGAGANLNLATDGKTDYVIVEPEKANAVEKRAARELQLWLGEICGAEFAIVSDNVAPQPRELCIGWQNRRVQALGALKPPPPGQEGYGIAVVGERLLLYGGSGRAGSLPAVYALLEEDLGVRWWHDESLNSKSWSELGKLISASHREPGEFYLQKRPTLKACVHPRQSTPGFQGRMVGSWKTSNTGWAVRNRNNFSIISFASHGQHSYVHGGLSVHTLHYLVPPKKYFAEHPEYFCLVKGKRRWKQAQLCLTHPEVAKIAAQTIISQSREGSHHYMVSVSQMDWLNECECETCLAERQRLGSYGGLQLQFANKIAELIRKERPGIVVTTLAYRQSKEAPPVDQIKTAPQVAVRFCSDFDSSFTWPYLSLFDATIAPARKNYKQWAQISEHMHLWIYPQQYRNHFAPMPNLHAVAENIRFFRDQRAEFFFMQQGIGDYGRRQLRYWLFSKLLWNPDLDVDQLMLDFTWAYYGKAAPFVAAYNDLLLQQSLAHCDFNRKRDWIHPIHNEKMFRFGFVEKARGILDQGLRAAEDAVVRKRVEELKLGVVFVEAVQLFTTVRNGKALADWKRYETVRDELDALSKRHCGGNIGFFDGSKTIRTADEFTAAMNTARNRLDSPNLLPASGWGTWRFRKDPEARGEKDKWYAAPSAAKDWTVVEVPAFLDKTPVGKLVGYGWYRVELDIPAEKAKLAAELNFEGVDEQAWLYLNGAYLGEHTLESEFIVGKEVTVEDLWNRSFAIKIPAGKLHPGKNVLAIRIHNSAMAAGIHDDVRLFFKAE